MPAQLDSPRTCSMPNQSEWEWKRRYRHAMLRCLRIQDTFLFGFMYEVENLLLADLAMVLPSGSTVVELGSFLGMSSRYLGMGTLISGSTLICVDTFTDGPDSAPGWQRMLRGFFQSTFMTNVEAALSTGTTVQETGDIDHIEPFLGTTSSAAKAYQGIKVDLLFVDADHTRAAQDVEEWSPMLQPWAMIVLDDVTGTGKYGPNGPDQTATELQLEGWKIYAHLGKCRCLTRNPEWWRTRTQATTDALGIKRPQPATDEVRPGEPTGTHPSVS